MPPQRRQSIASTSTAEKYRQGIGRKRAQSLAADEIRSQIAPRKSILKSTPFTFNPEDDISTQIPQNQSGAPEEDVTERTGMDYRAEITDNTTRKSLGRRVSFAPLAVFRVFESNDNTNSSGAPSSSPTPASPADSSPVQARPLPSIQLSNENDYPGRRSNTAPYRRASTASAYGERSMSLDMDQQSDDISEPPTDPVFFEEAATGVSDIGPPSTDFEEGTEEDDDEDDEDMEITEAIALKIERKQSLSIAQQHAMARRSSLSSLASRRRSSAKDLLAPSSEADEENSDERGRDEGDVTTNRQVTQGSEAPMEFTIALGEPLKEPKPPSDAWLALKAMTNGQTEGEDATNDEIELSNALSRLQQARSSLGLSEQDSTMDNLIVDSAAMEEASFASTDSSIDDSIDAGDRTLNVTNLVSRLEISGDESERSTGTIGDEDFAGPILIASTAPLNIPRKENSATPKVTSNVLSNSVFSNPPAENSKATSDRSHSPGAVKVSDASRPPSQLKTSLSSSVFSAPPPTPSRIPVPISPFKPRPPSPAKKRPAPPHDATSDASQPSPAKKRLLENSTIANQPPKSPNSFASTSPKPTDTSAAPASTAAAASRESLGGIRRPSGYFAQRRSLTPAVANTLVASRLPSPAPNSQQGLSVSNDRQGRRGSTTTKGSGKVHDENEPILPSPALDDKTYASAPTVPPVVIIPPDDTQEVHFDDESMDIETEKQVIPVPRRSLVSSEAPPFDEELPSISIKEFFLMTGVKFHDYTIPRRSTIYPSQLQGNRRDSSMPPSMSDFLTAMVVHVPQLELYRLITKDLQTFIDNSMKIYREAEEEVAKLSPVLFREYAQANEEGREELLHQLKLIKANRLLAAKDRWYDVRSRWVQSLQQNVDRGFAELEKDRDTLTSFIHQAQALLPALRQQHAQVQAQLEREHLDISDLENSDPVYLEELKVTIEEQNQLLDVYGADVAEGNAKQERLEGKLAELEAQRLENVQAIEAAERRITLNKNSTQAEVFRLRDELECLEALHSWRVSKVSQHLVELVFNEQFLVSAPCSKFRPIVPNITVTRLDRHDELKQAKRRADMLPSFSDLVIRQGESFARRLSTTSIKRVVEALSDFWTSCTQIGTQFTFLGIKYPLKLEPIDGVSEGLKAVASILLHKHKTKVLVAFLFSPEVLASWPFSIPKLECQVKTAYGPIDAEEVRKAIMERLSEASVAENHACLLDSCVEAASRFE